VALSFMERRCGEDSTVNITRACDFLFAVVTHNR
jgi:hypothetical protein